MYALGVESCLRRDLPQDQEDARPCERSPLRVQEQLRAMAAVKVGAAARLVAAQRLRRLPADRDDPFLAALAGAAQEARVEVDAAAVEACELRDAEASSVEELDNRRVAECARRRPRSCLDQPLRLAGRESPRQLPWSARGRELGRRVVVTSAEEQKVAVERAQGGDATRNGGRCETVGSQLGDVPLERVGFRRCR
jgi:hypothetical protein